MNLPQWQTKVKMRRKQSPPGMEKRSTMPCNWRRFSEGELGPALEQIQARLQEQEQLMAQLCQEHPEDAVLQQT